VTVAKGRVRSGRSAGGAPVVAVSGASGAIGTAIVRALAGSDGVAGVVALDESRGAVDGPVWKIGPLDSPEVLDRLRGADAVVHVATQTDLAAALTLPTRERRAHAVRSMQAVATSAAALGVRRLVVVTSAAVLGARPENPVPLPDDAVPAAALDDGLVGDLLEVEAVLEAAVRSHPGLTITVVRPAAVVGAGVDTVVTRHFEAPRLLALRGTTMQWQFCHVDDLARAVLVVLERELGIRPVGARVAAVPVGSAASLSAAEVERLSGMRRVEVPAAMAFSTAERLHRMGVLPAPAGDLSYVVYPWVVSATELTEAGWRPVYSNEECLQILLDGVGGRHAVAGRRLGTRDAAMGAAGAAVAVIGTAALVRRARARR
jgi:nucleoside-diphosphate-sugar epimerase